MPQSKPASDNKIKMVFWPHPDQEEIITAALDAAKKAVSTEYQTVALEAICQAYMGTGISFKTWPDALLFYAKATSDPFALAQEVVTLLKKLLPTVVINVTIAPKDKAQSETPL